MDVTISAKRKNDAVITVCQNNQDRQLVIEGMNRAAEKLTGYRQLELIDKSLQKLLPEQVNDLLDGYLDYGDMGSDLATVLRRVRDFHVLNRNGEEVPVSLKVFYMLAAEGSKLKFELLMRNVTLLQKLEELKSQVAARYQGQGDIYDANTGLLKESAIIDCLNHSHRFLNDYMLEVSFGIIGIDGLDKIASKNQVTVEEILRQLGEKLGKTFRTDDIVGCLDHTYICAILFDCSAEDAQKAFARVKSMCEKNTLTVGKLNQKVPLTLSVGYMQLSKDMTAIDTIDKCKRALQKAQEVGGDRIYEVVE